jgi:hypothetical protein
LLIAKICKVVLGGFNHQSDECRACGEKDQVGDPPSRADSSVYLAIVRMFGFLIFENILKLAYYTESLGADGIV